MNPFIKILPSQLDNELEKSYVAGFFKMITYIGAKHVGAMQPQIGPEEALAKTSPNKTPYFDSTRCQYFLRHLDQNFEELFGSRLFEETKKLNLEQDAYKSYAQDPSIVTTFDVDKFVQLFQNRDGSFKTKQELDTTVPLATTQLVSSAAVEFRNIVTGHANNLSH